MASFLYFVVDERSCGCGCNYETIREPLGLYPTIEQAQASIQEIVDTYALERWQRCNSYTNIPSIYRVEVGKRWDSDVLGEMIESPPTKWTEEAWRFHPDYEQCEAQKAVWREQQVQSDRKRQEAEARQREERRQQRRDYIDSCKRRGVDPFPGARAVHDAKK